MTWLQATIGDVCLPTAQRDPSRNGGTTFRYVDIAGIDRELKTISRAESIPCADAPSRARKEIRSGDVIVSTVRPNLNAIAQIPEELDGEIASTGFAVLRANPRVVDSRFLFYRAQHQTFVDFLVANATGASYPAVSDAIVRRAPLPLPPPTEQVRIVELLDEADRLRRLRREADAKAARILPALFLKMFGDPATNPMGWSMKPLGDLLSGAEVFVDGDWVESKDQDPNGEVRLIQLADIGDGFYIDKSSRFLTKETALHLRCTFLKPGDVLVARMPDPLGRACIFPGDEKEAVTVVDVCVIRPGVDGPDPYWLMHCINSTGFRALIAQQQTGTTRARISRGNLSRLPIICPPLPLQQEFSRLSKQTTEALPVAGAAGIIDQLFELLLQRAFSGQLTAKWREVHMKELLAEMEQQARLLNLPMPIEREALV